MAAPIVKVDLVIIGGGIAGLWTLTRARQQGYSAILLEQDMLGSAQTIASQGMIHGGIKYALGGKLSGESEAIAAMPGLWERCLDYHNAKLDTPNAITKIDLSQTQVLSRDFYLWSSGLIGRLGSFLASKSLRGRVENLKPKNFPNILNNPAYKGSVYRLIDCVVDIPSLLKNLAALNPQTIFKIDWQQAQWLDAENTIDHYTKKILKLNDHVYIQAQRFIFTAGKGNRDLLTAWNEHTPEMQLRPLQQVIVKHNITNAMLYGHCIGTQIQASPRLSISSHTCSDGQTAWYLGGDLATQNIHTAKDVLIKKAQQELKNIFPWLSFEKAQWQTLMIDRAEPKQEQLLKPDSAFVKASNDKAIITAWPTKLTLAPDMAEKILAQLNIQAVSPITPENLKLLNTLDGVEIATPPWENVF